MLNGRISSADPFAVVLAPLLNELDKFYWLFDVQHGPFRITDRSDYKALDAHAETLRVRVPFFDDLSLSLWRPGTLASFATLLVHDEEQYHFALDRRHDIAVSAAVALSASPRDRRVIEENASFVAYFGKNGWAIFASDAQVISLLGRVADLQLTR